MPTSRKDALVFRIVHASDAAGHAEHALGDFAGYEFESSWPVVATNTSAWRMPASSW